MWIDPIYNRTQTDVDYARENRNNPEHLKGAQNYSDWQRLTDNMYYLADVLNEYGYSIEITCKNEWDIYDIPSETEIENIKSNLNLLKEVFFIFSTTPITPEMPFTHYEKINALERILFDISVMIEALRRYFVYSNMIYSGEGMEGVAGIIKRQYRRLTINDVNAKTIDEMNALTMNTLIYGVSV